MKTKFPLLIIPLLLGLSPIVNASPLPPSAPVIGQAGNLLVNGNFESGQTTPVNSAIGVSTASALSSWNQYANSPQGTTSSWVTSPLIEGQHTAGLQGGLNNGLFQYAFHPTDVYTLSGWFFTVAGSAQLGLAWNDGSNSAFSAPTSLIGQWEYLSLTLALPGSTSGALVYGAANGNNQWYVEGLWLNSGATNNSPFAPTAGFNPNAVPDSGPTFALLLIGLASLGGSSCLRRARSLS